MRTENNKRRSDDAAARGSDQAGPSGAGPSADTVQISQVHRMAFVQAMTAACVLKETAAKEMLLRIAGDNSGALRERQPDLCAAHACPTPG